MSRLKTIFRKFTPDLDFSFSRFPFVFLLLAVATAIFIAGINSFFDVSESVWGRWFGGFFSASAVALAGYLFKESRSGSFISALILTYILPILVILVFQVHSSQWVFIPALPVAILLWLSVSPFTKIGRAEERVEQQDIFWWYNHRALVSAFIVGIALVIFGLGLFAISSSLDVLFGLDVNDLFYQWIYPVFCVFLGPVYWLTTLPKLESFIDEKDAAPDFISRAIGLLGQYILTPLLLIYAVILFAYAVQIAVSRALPAGTLGWMVLSFVIVGAVNVLILHPSFLKEKIAVKLFKRFWFWTTLIPLCMYFFAVWVRIDLYGLTPQRVFLIAGGLWASIISLWSILPNKRDIRLIPALSSLIFVMLGLGPLNAENLSTNNQIARLNAVLQRAEVSSSDAFPTWTKRDIRAGNGAIVFLRDDASRQKKLDFTLEKNGFITTEEPASNSVWQLANADFRYDLEGQLSRYLTRKADFVPVDVRATPLFIGDFYAYDEKVRRNIASLHLELKDNALVVYAGDTDEIVSTTDFSAWVEKQTNRENLVDPWLDFVSNGTQYRLVLTTVTLRKLNDEALDDIISLEGQLFKSPLSN